MRIDQTQVPQSQQQVSLMSSPVGELHKGAMVKGEVVQVGDGTIQLKMENGEVLKAALMGDANVVKGENVTLQVVGRAQGQTVMQLVPPEVQVPFDNTIALRSTVMRMGVVPSEQNINIASLLDQSGAKLTPEMFNKVQQILQNNPGLALDKAVFLASNSMEGNAQQIAVLNQLVGDNPLAGQVMGQVLAAMNDALAQQSAKAAATMQGAVEGAAGALASEEAGVAAQAQPSDGDGVAAVAQRFTLIGGRGEAASQTQSASAAPYEQSAANALIKFIGEDNSKAAKFISDRQLEPNVLQVLKDAASNDAIAGRDIIKQFVNQLPKGLSEFARDSLTVQLESAAIALKQNVGESAVIARGLSQSGELGGLTGAQPDTQALLGALTKGLSNMFAKFPANIEEGTNALKAAADQFGDRLDAAKVSAELASRLVEGKGLGLEQLGQLAAQNKFSQEIQQFTYLQIPLELRNQKQTAELFVFKRDPSKKRIDPENVTMVVALDTEHMRRVESVIKVKGKNVSLRIRVEREESIPLFKENTVELHHSLEESGFRLIDVKVQPIDERITPVNAAAMVADEMDRKLRLVDIKI